MSRVKFDLPSTEPDLQPPCGDVTSNQQKRRVKTVILRRTHPNEDWGLEISGKGWQHGEWMRK